MFYNKNKVEYEMQKGIDDPDDIVESMFDLINDVFKAIEEGNESELSRLKGEWEENTWGGK